MATMGRPKKTEERYEARLPVYLTPSKLEQLKAEVGEGEVSSLVRELLDAYLEGRAPGGGDTARDDSRTLDLPILGTSVCGNWVEAIGEAETTLPVNDAVSRLLDAHAEDFFVPVRGRSMEGAGIMDGAFLLVSLLPPLKEPRRGQITLMQIETDDGKSQSSVKRWMGKDGQLPILHDGEGKAFKFPKNTVSARPVAVARGAITSF